MTAAASRRWLDSSWYIQAETHACNIVLVPSAANQEGVLSASARATLDDMRLGGMLVVWKLDGLALRSFGDTGDTLRRSPGPFLIPLHRPLGSVCPLLRSVPLHLISCLTRPGQ